MSYQKKPKMILFDVGGTLFLDGPCDLEMGFAGLLPYAYENSGVTVVQMAADCLELEKELSAAGPSASGFGTEICLQTVLRWVNMKHRLEYPITLAQQEELFDRYNSARELAPGIVELLQDLEEMNIRTAVISNNMMSGESLAIAIRHWLPEAKMEFCLTSSDLQLCKPWGGLFEAAAAWAGVDAADCWYCGDSRIPDVDGARNGGMTPVLYDSGSGIPREYRTDGGRGPYMTINHWNVLSEHLKQL